MKFSCQNLSMIYPGTRFGFEDFQFEVPDGGWLGIVGTSGCGKSTFLRVISSLISKTQGEFSFDPHRTPRMGYVFQEASLLPWKTVEENIRFFNPEGDFQAFQSWVDLLKLRPVLDRYPSELSGGMKMRVSFARALYIRPDVLLLDEPFGALDEPIRIELGMALRHYWEKHRPLIFFVTHSLTEAAWLSDEVMVLKGTPGQKVFHAKVPLPIFRDLHTRSQPEFSAFVQNLFEVMEK